MEIYLYWVLKYLLLSYKLFLVMTGILGYEFEKKLRLLFISITSIMLFVLFIRPNTPTNTVLMYLVIVLSVITIIHATKGKNRLLVLLAGFMIITVIDLFLFAMILIVANQTINIIGENYIMSFIGNLVSIPVIIGVIQIRKKKKLEFFKSVQFLKKRAIVLIILIGVGIGLYIMPIIIFGINKSGNRVTILFAIGFIIVSMSIVLGMFSLLRVSDSRIYYQRLAETNEKFVKQQQTYYLSILDKEQATKKFRHDVDNHLICLMHLYQEEKYEELGRYLKTISSTMSELKPKVVTGNDIVNIIVHELISGHRDEGLKFKWEGQIPKNINIDSMDLCTLFSNLLSNALEAAIQVDKERFINIEVNVVEDCMIIKTRNSVYKKVSIINNRIKTSKKKIEFHGLGTQNTEDTVKRYDGSITYECDDDVFSAVVYLPHIIIGN